MAENGEHAMQAEENLEKMEGQDPQEETASQKHGKDSKGNSEKRGRRKGTPAGGQVTPKKPEMKEATTPLIDRPARERKSIERFADSVEKEKEKPKEFKIEQGSGTHLRDIPNVVFKLSKRKTSDESVQLLHKLLYNKRVKPHQVKANIFQFSGFVWGPNEEKEKTKMKEKLEKIVKENLFQLSDLLDLAITRTTKKEDVVLRVLEFLECPHKTTEKLVQEEEQRLKEKKRKKTPAKGKRKKGSGQKPSKRQKQEDVEEQDEEAEEGEEEDVAEEEPEEEQLEEEQPEEEPEEELEEGPKEVLAKKKNIKIKEPSPDAKSHSSKKPSKRSAKKSIVQDKDVEDPEDPVEEPEEVKAEPEEDHEEPKRKRSKNKKYEDDAVPSSPKKGVRKSVKTKSVYAPEEEDLDVDNVKDVKSKPLSKVTKKEASKESKTPVGGSSKEKKISASSSSKASSKKKKKEDDEDAPVVKTKKGRGASKKEESESSSIPPDEDLRAAICALLRDADFGTVTFTDVVKELGAKFSVDLSQNKAHVKNLIQEEISKIVDEDDGDNEDDETGVNTPERGEKEPIEAAATED